MIIRKTSKTVQRKEYLSARAEYKSKTLYDVTTYWFLFIPVYSSHKYIKGA